MKRYNHNIVKSSGITPSGIAYVRPKLTGQTIIYRTGDDAWAVINRPPPANPTNPIYWAELDTFTTLVNNNVFGNKNRFTDELGGQNYTNGYAIDHYTGLGWNSGRGYGDWNTVIDNPLSFTDALGNSDYFLANQNQMDSIYNEAVGQFLYSPFNAMWRNSGFWAWNSTTIKFNGNGRRSNIQYRGLSTTKTTNNYGIRCRWHF